MACKLSLFLLLAMAVTVTVAYDPIGHLIAKRAALLDEQLNPTNDELVRPRRAYSSPIHNKHKRVYTRGRVGPVYTYVKTDYDGNFKWGVRHKVGQKYAGSYHR